MCNIENLRCTDKRSPFCFSIQSIRIWHYVPYSHFNEIKPCYIFYTVQVLRFLTVCVCRGEVNSQQEDLLMGFLSPPLFPGRVSKNSKCWNGSPPVVVAHSATSHSGLKANRIKEGYRISIFVLPILFTVLYMNRWICPFAGHSSHPLRKIWKLGLVY